ncbi:right-handed parallel beta-helix repeat-containing protein, partial [Bartonella schoenbuchensis]|uniref:right-handed parallel beta-helix repeat-containing protein n=1 Tax=Bartonella schoenbuchensis TaxID=165694 RepID=UPI001ABB0ECD
MISKVGAGVYVKRGKSLTIGGSSRIEFTDGYGVMVGSGVKRASLTKTVITGKGSGMGTGVIMESSGKMTLENVTISKVQTGVYAENGELEIKGKTTIDFKESGWGVYVKGEMKSV